MQAIYRIVYILLIKKERRKYIIVSSSKKICLNFLLLYYLKYRLHDRENTINLVIIFVRRKYAKYHFDYKSRVDVFVGNRETYRTGSLRYSIGRNVTRKLKYRINIKGIEGDKTVFLLSKKAMDITSSDKKANSYPENGDTFFENCVVL